MKNEIQRKTTSLTLMAIMVLGGVSFAVPGVMPAAYAANANLFVSAEESKFGNYMSGPQVIEVVIIDSDINDTNEAKGEPDVTVNGKILRMVQATDGNWYGYFADRAHATLADSLVTTTERIGLNFGKMCESNVRLTTEDAPTAPDTVGVFLPREATCTTNSGLTSSSIDTTRDTLTQNVVRESKDINPSIPSSSNSFGGQIGVHTDLWPFIQLYNLNPTGNVNIQYNPGSTPQVAKLTFDTAQNFAKLDLDRDEYPRSAQVHVTVTDLWLNIDPTDEDSWTWNTVTGDAYYQIFDENGVGVGVDTDNPKLDKATLGQLQCDDNCILLMDPDVQGTGNHVLRIQDNDDTAITSGTNSSDAVIPGLPLIEQPITLTEQGPRSGVFGSYDEGDTSVLQITRDAARGVSASIEYNEDGKTILVGFGFATIDIKPHGSEWSSGEEAPIELRDSDANKNSRADEDLDLFDPNVALIPALSTGTPFTLETATGVSFFSNPVSPPNATTGIVSASGVSALGTPVATGSVNVEAFSQRAVITATAAGSQTMVLGMSATLGDLKQTIHNAHNIRGDTEREFRGTNLINYDVRSVGPTLTTPILDSLLLLVAPAGSGVINGSAGTISTGTVALELIDASSKQALVSLNSTSTSNPMVDATDVNTFLFGTTANDDRKIGFAYEFGAAFDAARSDPMPIVTDFFSFGFIGDGDSSTERIANQIIRIEAEENADNSGTFTGTLEYVMVNQLNILDESTYTGLSPIANDPSFIVIEDLTDEDSPRVNYLDLGHDGVSTQISDQQEAPSHSGVVSLDGDNYKVADTVTITLNDLDLNIDPDLKDIYTVVRESGDIVEDAVGKSGLPTKTRQGTDYSFGPLGRLLDVTFDDEAWKNNDCADNRDGIEGLSGTGFTLVETGAETGSFMGSFQIPLVYCSYNGNNPGIAKSVTGTDIEVNYVDYRDASGEIIEVGDSAGVRANTGSISLDRTVYPVPWGQVDDYGTISGSTPGGRSVFPIHESGIKNNNIDVPSETLGNGDLTIHVRVNDPDFDVSATGEDTLAHSITVQHAGEDVKVGPVKITVSRGAERVVLAYAGATTASSGVIDVGDNDPDKARQLGGIVEISGDAGIFELDFVIRYTDGPKSTACPITVDYTQLDSTKLATDPESRFDAVDAREPGNHCILQGDIITVEYTDPTDASGDPNTVTDSATFDLRNGVLQSDKSVYIIGGDMILTIIEPDWDLDNDAAETYDLDVIEWDSDAETLTMGDAGGEAAKFDPEPTDLRETGDSTGIFQTVVEIPQALGSDNDNLERGEEIILEYTDWGPSGASYVGQEDEDINLTVFTSNFGATVELDQKVYSWTDKIYITIVAPDHNFDSDLIDEIGETNDDPIKVATRGSGNELDQYKLVETGTDTGIFTGEVILTGFSHDADGDPSTGNRDAARGLIGSDANPRTGNAAGTNNQPLGPTDGFLRAEEDDGVTVSFEFSDKETVVGSALIRWNIGEVQWLEASYPASGTGVVRVVDPDMNLDPESVDNFDVDVWSESDSGGIDLTVTETNEATGIFEGTVFFTTTEESSGHRLRVAEGDTITGRYEDHTLPAPHSTNDDLKVLATSFIGALVPPLEQVPAKNLRTTDSSGNTLGEASVDQQIQFVADVTSGVPKDTVSFVYIVQVQDADGVTVSLSWIGGSLAPGQSFAPSASWTPTAAGTYDVTAFVWESLDSPTALSPTNELSLTVS